MLVRLLLKSSIKFHKVRESLTGTEPLFPSTATSACKRFDRRTKNSTKTWRTIYIQGNKDYVEYLVKTLILIAIS